MSDIVEAARKRIVTLKQEIETLEEFVESAKKAAAILGSTSRIPEVTSAPDSPVENVSATSEDATRPAKARNPPWKVMGPMIRSALIEANRPMTRREIFEALKSRGLTVQGTDPVKTLGTILWRAQNDIQSIEGAGYWPSGLPTPTNSGPLGRLLDGDDE